MAAAIERMNDAVATVHIHGSDINVYSGRTITQLDLECAVGSKIFRDWARSLDPLINVMEVTIQGIYYRGAPSPDRVLFVMMVAGIAGTYPTSIVLRGPTVVILPVLVCGKDEYTLGALQRRPATGSRFYPEIIAGMSDGIDLVSAGLKEFEQETSIKIRQKDLIPLGKHAEPSPGIMSEPMHFFYVRKQVTHAELALFEDKLTGERDEGEEIILKVIPLDHLPLFAPHDMKAEIVYRRYRELFPKRRGWFS